MSMTELARRGMAWAVLPAVLISLTACATGRTVPTAVGPAPADEGTAVAEAKPPKRQSEPAKAKAGGTSARKQPKEDGPGMHRPTTRSPHAWQIHDMDRPQPEVVKPGQTAAAPPADAIVLFDGTDLSGWRHKDGQTPAWKVENGYMEVAPKCGDIFTRKGFGDVQLHVEFATPTVIEGEGQKRGNSGVFFMGTYEVQVLDSHNNKTYPDGQCGAVYGQYPPLVNASRPPGEWQTFDIIFRRPRFTEDHELATPAVVTVIHNGVLVQDHVELVGPTSHKKRRPYQTHDSKLPIKLQDHKNPMRFRNIWVRELE